MRRKIEITTEKIQWKLKKLFKNTEDKNRRSDHVKDGHCPVPSGELGTCAQQCTSDANCYGNMKCCHNGCGTQCMELPMSDAQGPCRFANMMLETAISSMGNSASDSELYVPQCEADGTFAKLQCHYNLNVCWCANSRGVMIPDTLVDLHEASNAPTCEDTVLNENCNPLSTTCTRTCDFGLNVGADGCPVCECYFPCSGFTCSPGTKCRAMHVLCTEPSCTGLPECVPEVDPTVCADGVNVVDCLIDPCQSATCGNNLRQDIECRTNYCGGCSAEFYDTNGNKVDCSAQDLVCPRGKEDVVTVCIDRCSTSQCPDGLMCCSVGCSKECVRPVPAHMTPCQQASLMAQNLQSGNQGDSSSESTIIVPRERSIPRCTTDGNYEQVQCSESIGICWCVDENNGTKISGSEVRGNPDCSADAPRHDVYIQICDTEVVQQCSRNLCYEAVCLANPTAVCRVNPCGTCTVEFYDASNQIVDCAYNLTPCQISRQTAMNNNNRGFGSFTDSLLDSLPDHVSDFVNQLGGVCGIPSIGGGGIPGIGDQGRLPNIDDIFQVLFGEGTNEMPNLDQLTNLLQSWGGVNLDDAEDFNLQHIFDGIGDLWDGLFGDRHRRRSGEEDARGDGILKSDDPLFGPYIPQCGNDNNFAWKQCRGNTGICWCVDKDGSPIDGTVAMRPNSERMLCTESGADHVEPAVCFNGNPVDLCLDVSCQRTRCPGNPEAFCVIDPCNNCQETWRTCDDLSSVVDCTAERPVSTCPKDRPQQVCGEDMCSNAICRWNRCARCTVDVCGQCQVKFLDENGDVVDCDKPVTKCELENQCRPTNMLGSFVPDCLTDGSYNPVQCHGSTGYCWCVDQAGMEIDNTRQRGNRPDCGDVSIQSVTVTF
ncbi:uncharacterized protein LOC144364068, partial [Saccoglossus kowalevskii]